jgi:hypothetical protein
MDPFEQLTVAIKHDSGRVQSSVWRQVSDHRLARHAVNVCGSLSLVISWVTWSSILAIESSGSAEPATHPRQTQRVSWGLWGRREEEKCHSLPMRR